MICQTCGNPRQEHFCPNCGEKRHDPHALTLRHYAEETLEGFTHFDHRFFRSGRALLFKPGLLTAEFVEGRRVRYMLPLPLFLVCNLLFFALLTNNPFSQPLNTFVRFAPYTQFGTVNTVRTVLTRTGETEKELTVRFNAAMRVNSKTYLFALIPVFAGVFAMAFARRGRTFIGHLIFATHFMAFMLLFYILEFYLLTLPIQWLLRRNDYSGRLDALLSLIGLAVFGVYLFGGVRRFYGVSPGKAVLAVALTLLTFVAVLYGYRMLLFYKILLLQ